MPNESVTPPTHTHIHLHTRTLWVMHVSELTGGAEDQKHQQESIFYISVFKHMIIDIALNSITVIGG